MPDMKTLEINGVVYNVRDSEAARIADTIQVVESTEYPGCYYRMVDGEQEWLNPPLVAGVEYRTMERYKGKIVYVILTGKITVHHDQVKRISYCGQEWSTESIAIHPMFYTYRNYGYADSKVGLPPFVNSVYATWFDEGFEDSYVVFDVGSFIGTGFGEDPEDPETHYTIASAIVKYTKEANPYA